MSSIYGKNIKVSIFGESHGGGIGVTINGIKAGLKIDFDFIKSEIKRRKPIDHISTSRKEEDTIEVVSGIFNGYTTGSPITIIVKNNDLISKDYDKNIIRPSHADYTAYIKYDGYNDYRGGGHFSGRITVAIVIAGAICKQILKKCNIQINSHIKSIAGIFDKSTFCDTNELTFSKVAWDEMQNAILLAKEKGNSVGGIIEAFINGVPAGIGEPFFDSVESVLSHLLFSIPAVKGVEFGAGFDLSNMTGSEANDEISVFNDDVYFKSNNNGGINGGITNGSTIVVRTCIKPTPSIGIVQNTIDIEKKENIKYKINGRHDPCIVPRTLVIIESMLAIGILDLYMDYLMLKGLTI